MNRLAHHKGTAVAVLVVAAAALAYYVLSPSPAGSAGLSGLESLPTVPWPSNLSTGYLPRFASATGLTTDEAQQHVRVIQKGLSLGSQTVDLYAFLGERGSACSFLAPGGDGVCLPVSCEGSADLPVQCENSPSRYGVAWTAVSGNVPMTARPSGSAAVFGLAADNVRSLVVVVGGARQRVPISHNTFYADYDSISSTDSIKLVVSYEDGTTKTFHGSNPYAGYGPTGQGGF